MGKKRRKKGSGVKYDYENTFDKDLHGLDQFFVEEMMRNKVGLHYATKTIRSGRRFEVEIYPVFRKREDIPVPRVRYDARAQGNLNEKNSKKAFIRVVETNFGEGDYWMTLTYDPACLPATKEEAQRKIGNYIRRVNRRRKKMGLANAKYVYITEWGDVRCHHHLIIEGGLSRDVLESLWGFSTVKDSSRLYPGEDGLAGLATYMADKKRGKWERRWTPSKNLKKPAESVNHSKARRRQVEGMARDFEEIRTFFAKDRQWARYEFREARVMYNNFNSAFYIHILARERRRRDEEGKQGKGTGGGSGAAVPGGSGSNGGRGMPPAHG